MNREEEMILLNLEAIISPKFFQYLDTWIAISRTFYKVSTSRIHKEETITALQRYRYDSDYCEWLPFVSTINLLSSKML